MQLRHQATLAQPLNCNAFCSITSQTCTYLRTWQHRMTTIMQPFQCDLQPQIQETHRTTTRCRTQRRNQNDPSRNRRTHEVPFIAGRSHFNYTEKHKVVLLCDVKSHTALVIAYDSFVMYCYVMSSLTPPFINVKSHNSICP